MPYSSEGKSNPQSFSGTSEFSLHVLLALVVTSGIAFALSSEQGWIVQHNRTTGAVRTLLSFESVLGHYDKQKPLILTCDVFPNDIAAALSRSLKAHVKPPACSHQGNGSIKIELLQDQYGGSCHCG